MPNLKVYKSNLDYEDFIRKTVFEKIKEKTGTNIENLIEVEHKFYPEDFIKRYNIKSVIGDAYSAEFVVQAFVQNGIRYKKSELNKSQLYLELLPRICSGEIELLDNELMINQLSNLERRTRSGGRDIVDHPNGAKDDCANVTAGICLSLGKPKVFAGGGFVYGDKKLLLNV